MNMIIRLLLTALAVMGLAEFLNGISITDWKVAIIVSLVLALLNTFLRPILVFLTIPATIVTLGLFLLVINAGIILLCGKLVGGFQVDGWLSALIFSVLLCISQGILYRLFGVRKGKKSKKVEKA